MVTIILFLSLNLNYISPLEERLYLDVIYSGFLTHTLTVH